MMDFALHIHTYIKNHHFLVFFPSDGGKLSIKTTVEKNHHFTFFSYIYIHESIIDFFSFFLAPFPYIKVYFEEIARYLVKLQLDYFQEQVTYFQLFQPTYHLKYLSQSIPHLEIFSLRKAIIFKNKYFIVCFAPFLKVNVWIQLPSLKSSQGKQIVLIRRSKILI